MQHVIKKRKKRGLWPKLAIRHGQVQKNNAADAAEAKKAADAKELANLKSQISREIEGHIVGHHSGAINYTRTDSERNTLRGFAGQYNNLATVKDAERVLSAVRIAKNKLGR